MLSWRKQSGDIYHGIHSAEIVLCGITQRQSVITFPTITDALSLGDIIEIAYDDGGSKENVILNAVVAAIIHNSKQQTSIVTLSPLWRFAGQSAPYHYGQFQNISLAGLLTSSVLPHLGIGVNAQDFADVIPEYTINPTDTVAALAVRFQDFGKLVYAPDGKTLQHFTPNAQAIAYFEEGKNILQQHAHQALIARAMHQSIGEAQDSFGDEENIIIRHYRNISAPNAELAAKTAYQALRLTHAHDFLELTVPPKNQPLAKPADKIVLKTGLPNTRDEYIIRQSQISISPLTGIRIIYQAVPLEVLS